MIYEFKDNEMRNSGVVYNSTLEQIKKLYYTNPQQAGELAISAIELVLTGDISSDDMMIGLLLEPMKKINENNQKHYDIKVESNRNKKIRDMKLDQIAEMVEQGYKQREIGEKLGLSQQIISYRVSVIKKEYPELLPNSLQKNKETYKQNTNKIQNTNESACIQKQKVGNKKMFVKNESVCENQELNEVEVNYTKDFVF